MNVVCRTGEKCIPSARFGGWGGGVGARRVQERCEHLRRFLLILEMHTSVLQCGFGHSPLRRCCQEFPQIRCADRTGSSLHSICVLRIVLILEHMKSTAASDPV
jgi:hypothetical protein